MISFIEGDTDSMYWAISGNPEKDYTQKFEYVVKNKKFYNENKHLFFPDESLKEGTLERIQSEKKLLGLAIEKEGENCIALAPKCYTIWDNRNDNSDETTKAIKLKGVSLEKNDIKYEDYLNVLKEGNTKVGKNINLQLKDSTMCKITVIKNALTGAHTTMVVLDNQSCAPFIKDAKYAIKKNI